MAYWRLFYHFVWTTKNREPLLVSEVETLVHRCVYAEARKMYSPLCIIGSVKDHIHVLIALRPAVAPAEGIKQIKGSSSHLVTQVLKQPFEWQQGYGIFSVSEYHVDQVARYILHQKQHHAQKTLILEWEQVGEHNLGPEDTNYSSDVIIE